jgi:hypothetical protein
VADDVKLAGVGTRLGGVSEEPRERPARFRNDAIECGVWRKCIRCDGRGAAGVEHGFRHEVEELAPEPLPETAVQEQCGGCAGPGGGKQIEFGALLVSVRDIERAGAGCARAGARLAERVEIGLQRGHGFRRVVFGIHPRPIEALPDLFGHVGNVVLLPRQLSALHG